MYVPRRILVFRCTGCLIAAAALAAFCDSARPDSMSLRVAVLGAHPDDPESGAGGLIAMLTNAGYHVDIGYMVCYRQGRTYFGRPEAEVRREEATAACAILGATPKFFDYSAENLPVNATTVAAVSTWLNAVDPDIVVAHWPQDTHPDHVAAGEIARQCYANQGTSGGWNLYQFEVNTGLQTLGFTPNLYLDIGDVRSTKQQAVYCHTSQDPALIWQQDVQMQRNRGAECGVQYAEAYSLLEARPGCALLPVQFITPAPEPSTAVLSTVGGLVGLTYFGWRRWR